MRFIWIDAITTSLMSCSRPPEESNGDRTRDMPRYVRPMCSMLLFASRAQLARIHLVRSMASVDFSAECSSGFLLIRSLSFDLGHENVTREFDGYDSGRGCLLRHVVDAADELTWFELGDSEAVDFGAGSPRINHHETFRWLVPFDEALRGLRTFPGPKLA